MCATLQTPSTGGPETVPVIRVWGGGTTCAAGSSCGRQAQRGKVQSGSPSGRHSSCHWRSPACPVAPVGRSVAPSAAAQVLSSYDVDAGLGPKRSHVGSPSEGKTAVQPCAYGLPARGATVSRGPPRPAPLARSVAVREL